jgi:hypothetical protein
VEYLGVRILTPCQMTSPPGVSCRYKVSANMRDWFVPPIVIPVALFLFVVVIAVFHT